MKKLSMLKLFSLGLFGFFAVFSVASADVVSMAGSMITLTAAQNSVNYGGSTTLTWHTTGVSSCNATQGTNGWAGGKGTSGSFGTGALTSTTTYKLTCKNAGNIYVTATETIYVTGAPQKVTVSLRSDPSNINSGSTSTLSWTSTNATSCTASSGANGWAGGKSTNGSQNSGALYNTTYYSITCSNGSSSASDSTTVTVNQIQKPTVTLNANPSSINSGSSSTLTWNSNNATSCTASSGTNGWAGGKGLSGSFNTGALFNTTYYTITCSNSAGSATASTDVDVNQIQKPTVSLSSNPSSINSGSSSTLTWTSHNATSCVASNGTNGWAGGKSTNGSQSTGTLTSTTYYNITCSNSAGSASDSTTVTVNQVVSAPTVTLTANPTSVNYGGSSVLSWTSHNATSCIASGGTNGWSGTQNISGTFSTGALTNTTTYIIICSNSSGQQATSSAVVTVGTQTLLPTVSLVANPTSIQSGSNSTLSWTSTNAVSCSAYWTSSTATSGSGIVVPTGTTTYVIICTSSTGQQATSSATVYVNSQSLQPTVNIYSNPSTVNYNSSSVISWNSTNASYCSATGGTNGWSGTQSTSGSFSTGPLTYTTTYNIVCTSSSGTQASDSTTVYVNNNSYQTTNVTITADQPTVQYNGSTIIRWYPNNATSCYGTGGSNGWANSQNASGGTFNTGPLTYTTTYSISCNGYNSASNTASVTVYVNNNQPINPIVNNNLDVVTTQATSVTRTSAQLNSLISESTGGYTATTAWFEWGTTINLGNRTTTTSVGNLPSVIHADTLSGLLPGTTYYFRAVATNSYQNAVGSILSFTTSGTQDTTTIVHYVNVNRTAPSSLVLITSSVNRDQPIVPTIDNTRPHPGDQINYTVNYQNVGTASITNLSLQLVLPAEVTYISSTPNNPNMFGNTLIFNLGTLRGNGNGSVTVRTQVNADAIAGTVLNFPATLTYVDPSGQPQSVTSNISAQVWSGDTGAVINNNNNGNSNLGAFAFGSGFFPTSLFGWLLLIILILILVMLLKYIYNKLFGGFQIVKKTTTTTTQS